MLFDVKNMFCHNEDCQDGTASPTIIAGDTVDIGDAGMNLGKGEPVFVGIIINEDVAGGTSIQFQLNHCATAGGSYTELAIMPAIPVAEATAGKEVKIPVPEGALQHIALSSIGVGTNTTGQITAGFVM
ncbi:MAG: hypothetical protein DRP59_06060 [Spirochaetes bacterium]|nr:MAG: hypothetical protein DRP59_06060 [Spirochaetota bacterium]